MGNNIIEGFIARKKKSQLVRKQAGIEGGGLPDEYPGAQRVGGVTLATERRGKKQHRSKRESKRKKERKYENRKATKDRVVSCVRDSPEIGRLSLVRLLHYQPKRPKGWTREGSKKHAVNKKAKRKIKGGLPQILRSVGF